jgi:hypothetical protein
MPNTQSQFNPAYSTIKSVFVGGLEISKQNTECRFEKIEIVENITEVLPRGALVVTDLKDIVSYVNYNAIDKVVIEWADPLNHEGQIGIISIQISTPSGSVTLT